MFRIDAPGKLVAISGSDPALGAWKHQAFVPSPLGPDMPTMSPTTYLRVADARAALAALDSTARQLPNPTLLRSPTLRTEAQSTSALEGTYAPLAQVLTADEDEPGSPRHARDLELSTHGEPRVCLGARGPSDHDGGSLRPQALL